MWYPILHRYTFHYQGNLILAQSFPLAVSTVTYCRQHGGRDHDHLFKIESFPVSAAPGPIRIQQNSAGASLGILALNVAQIASLGLLVPLALSMLTLFLLTLFLLALHMLVRLVPTVLKSLKILQSP